MAELATKLAPSAASASNLKIWPFQLQEGLAPTHWWFGLGVGVASMTGCIQGTWSVITFADWRALPGVHGIVASFEWPDAPVRQGMIEQADLPAGEPYVVKTPIPIKVTREDDVDFTAAFDEARISIGGESFRDAFEALVFEILDTFDYLTGHRDELGAETERQLDVLSKYIGKAHD